MKHLLPVLAIFVVLTVFCSSGLAQEEKNSWEESFIKDLTAIRSPQKTDAYGYTLSEEEALETAIKKAMDQKAPACEILKTAAGPGFNFNPYSVLSGIFSSKAKIDLELLCQCATETGDSPIPKSLMNQAANAAVEGNLLTRDEVTQAQCLQQGLGFTLAEPLERGDEKEKQPKYSAGG
ncbi:hypothetical protein [Desulfospira joergensenii]|uniref:hypothetical protein n=1 Tax=Desulfospira joergensenii TaxID=53329 RepID=UPI0003B3E402|nr:hypothetical protein [Desulfospira joergensenii]